MNGFRAAPALLALALIGALVAPSASLACQARQHRCPGMPPELAELCHKAGAMAPDCCKNERPSPERRAANELAAPALLADLPTSAATADAVDADDLRGVPPGFSRDARFHELGLFTLHSVFRI